MELFDKIYGCYYQIVAKILEEAALHPITQTQMQHISDTYGFEESALAILPKLTGGDWALLDENQAKTWSSTLANSVKTPITNLQKSWLKALTADPRIRLFFSSVQLSSLNDLLSDIEPLYDLSDFHYYDRYLDGDDYDSIDYQEHFQTIITALNTEKFLFVSYAGKPGAVPAVHEIYPSHLQYSAKDDKFRLYGYKAFVRGRLQPIILNLGRILACHISKREKPARLPAQKQHAGEPVLIEISKERNSLERCMLYFANYEKHTEYDPEKDLYYCSIYYNVEDETELLIQLLSFGPVIRILGPEQFLSQVRKRVQRQHELFVHNDA